MKFKKDEKKKASKEEREEALNVKITAEIKARKALADEAIDKSREEFAKASEENEIRYRKMHEERKQAVASIEAETAKLNAADRAAGKLSADQRKGLTDEEWVANLP